MAQGRRFESRAGSTGAPRGGTYRLSNRSEELSQRVQVGARDTVVLTGPSKCEHGRLGTRAERETRLPVLTQCSGAESTAVATAQTNEIVEREVDEKTKPDDAAARGQPHVARHQRGRADASSRRSFSAPSAQSTSGVAWPGSSATRYVRTRHIGTGLRPPSTGTSAMKFSLEEAVAQLAKAGHRMAREGCLSPRCPIPLGPGSIRGGAGQVSAFRPARVCGRLSHAALAVAFSWLAKPKGRLGARVGIGGTLERLARRGPGSAPCRCRAGAPR